MQQIDDRCFEAGKTEVQLAALHPGSGQTIGVGIAGGGQTIQVDPAGVGHSHGAGGLIEAFPRRVVPGAAQHAEAGVILRLHDVAVPAGDHQAEEGRLQLGEGQIVGGDMGAEVVDRNQGFARRQGQSLGEVDPYQQRADQARRVGNGHRIDRIQRKSCLLQRLPYHPADGLRVAAAGDLRHHAAVQLVLLHLGGHDAGENGSPVPHHRGGGFVAGRFDT